MPNSAIPTGRYWIVDRPTGSTLNQIRAWGIDTITGNDHSEWFALFSAQTMTDSILINVYRVVVSVCIHYGQMERVYQRDA
ncbi:tlde1 domain-containing protein [Enterobacter sp. DSM 30060]|uniref:tlde1 domain-containing protein n=1 Tax=Enterobacter sp. DSM 30060 TaxID=2747372 RepID=UPI00350F0DB5